MMALEESRRGVSIDRCIAGRVLYLYMALVPIRTMSQIYIGMQYRTTVDISSAIIYYHYLRVGKEKSLPLFVLYRRYH